MGSLFAVFFSAVLAASPVAGNQSESSPFEISVADCTLNGAGSDYAINGPYEVTELALERFEISRSSPAMRIFMPTPSADNRNELASAFLKKCARTILWANGSMPVLNGKKSKKYRELLNRWASFGFVVVAEESNLILTGSSSMRAAHNNYIDLLKLENSPNPKINETIIKFGMRDWKALKRFAVASGKSRGGSVARNYLARFNERISGYVCIAGCGIINRRNEFPGLYVTGTKDFARGLVKNAYSQSSPPKWFFKRTDAEHMDLDVDAETRNLTTAWLRCHFRKTESSCVNLSAAFDDRQNWAEVCTKSEDLNRAEICLVSQEGSEDSVAPN